MSNYQRLTKVVTQHNGQEMIACSFYGTDKCRSIHTKRGCLECPVFAAILNQLYAFEEIMEGTNGDTGHDTASCQG